MMQVILPVTKNPCVFHYGVDFKETASAEDVVIRVATTPFGYVTTVSGFDPLRNQIPLRDFSEVADVIRENLRNFQKL